MPMSTVNEISDPGNEVTLPTWGETTSSCHVKVSRHSLLGSQLAFLPTHCPASGGLKEAPTASELLCLSFPALEMEKQSCLVKSLFSLLHPPPAPEMAPREPDTLAETGNRIPAAGPGGLQIPSSVPSLLPPTYGSLRLFRVLSHRSQKEV